MKKTILSLIALFSVAVVSAQSYAKQPDPSIYEVVTYQKPVKTEVKEEAVESQDGVQKDQPKQERKEEKTSQEVKSTTAVAVNDDKSTNKKRQ